MSWTKRTPSKDPARHSENESSWAPRRDWQRGASPIPVSARWVCSAGAGSGCGTSSLTIGHRRLSFPEIDALTGVSAWG